MENRVADYLGEKYVNTATEELELHDWYFKAFIFYSCVVLGREF